MTELASPATAAPADSEAAAAPTSAELAGNPADMHGYDLQSFNVRADEAEIHAFASAMKEGGASEVHVHAALGWYRQYEAEQLRQLDAHDREAAASATRELRTAWGIEADENFSLVREFVGRLPAGLQHALRTATNADGVPVLSDVESLRWLARAARGGSEFAPRGMTPGQELAGLRARMANPKEWSADKASQARYRDLLRAGATPGNGPIPSGGGAIDDELAQLRRGMSAPRGTPEWNRYWKQGGESRYRALLQAKG